MAISYSLNCELFIVLYVAHKIADYILQTDKQAVGKSSKYKPLLIHCFIYASFITVLIYGTLGIWRWDIWLILFLSHAVLDQGTFVKWWAITIKGMNLAKMPGHSAVLIELDQAFHYVVLFVISFNK